MSVCSQPALVAVAIRRRSQAALQRQQRAAHPRLDGAERLAHLVGDLGVAQALVERERDALPLRALRACPCTRASARASAARLSRSSGPGASSATVSYTSSSSCVGVAGGGARRCTWGWVCSRRRLSMARLRAMLVSQVSGWLCAASKLLRRAPDVDVHLLQDVFGLGAVPVDTQHHGEQMRARPLVERGKSRTIAEPARASRRDRSWLRSVQSAAGLTMDAELRSGRRAPSAFLQFQRSES